jgi:replicative DNA helicase
LDDNKDIIFNRFLGILTRLKLNSIKFGFRQENPEDNDKLLLACTIIEELANEDRLDLRDISEVQTLTQIESIVREKGAEKLIVLIDGLHNAEIQGNLEGLREQNIERANRVKRLAEIHKIPVIVTAELRKREEKRQPDLSDLMESGKYAYNCDLALLLWNSGDPDFNAQTIEVNLRAAKNKLSEFKGTKTLYFTRACSVISETNPESSFANPFLSSRI